MILNASGCLDALEAPEVARALDAFVTKTVTPLPRQGNSPVRIAETEHGMENGETHGSPVGPLLRTSREPAASWAPAGQSPAPPSQSDLVSSSGASR